MEQAATRLQHAGKLVVERLRIQLAGEAEARRVVQDGAERSIRESAYSLADVTGAQGQTGSTWR